MNVKIYPEMIPKVDIHISIYPIPIHPSPILEKEPKVSECPLNGTEKRQKANKERQRRKLNVSTHAAEAVKRILKTKYERVYGKEKRAKH